MMSLQDITKAFEEGKKAYEEIMSPDHDSNFDVSEIYNSTSNAISGSISAESCNRIALGDNAEYMRFLLKEKHMAGRLQLIYVDPPFFSKGKYQASLQLESGKLGRSGLIKAGAYDDRWSRGMGDYLSMLTTRLFLMKELLSESGCIWVHLDWHVVHYAKIILDQIFGEDNFINEIIWTYKSGGTSKRSFAKKHDTLLLYGKSKSYMFNSQKEKSYNRDMKPYRFKGVEEFQDEKGWYTVVNMKDVWQIDMVGRTSGERTGYATQKPEKLMERIIASCSEEGSLCADFFAGSGTFGAVCSRMGRKWIMCDGGNLAVSDQIVRLSARGDEFALERHRRQDASPEHRKALDKTPEESRIELCIKNNEIDLISYDLDISQVDCGDKELVTRYLARDSLSLIKCWSVDPDFDGSVHRGEEVIAGGESKTVFNRRGKTGIISVKGYDVFGGEFFWTTGGEE